jgi:hypothetical protein
MTGNGREDAAHRSTSSMRWRPKACGHRADDPRSPRRSLRSAVDRPCEPRPFGSTVAAAATLRTRRGPGPPMTDTGASVGPLDVPGGTSAGRALPPGAALRAPASHRRAGRPADRCGTAAWRASPLHRPRTRAWLVRPDRSAPMTWPAHRAGLLLGERHRADVYRNGLAATCRGGSKRATTDPEDPGSRHNHR